MVNISELKQHLNAVKQTRQITNAMYLLSTSRMRKAMQNIDYNLSYLYRLRATMKDILSKTKRSFIHNPFIEQQSEGRALFVVATADKGLCAGFNSAVVELALEKMKDFKNPYLYCLGVIGFKEFERRGIKADFNRFGVSQHPTLYLSRRIAEKITDLYINHDINEVYIVYTEYVNSAVQTPVCRHILPLLRRDYSDIDYELKYSAEAIYEPSVEQVFEKMAEQYIVGYMYDVMMQSAASENSARMTAMQNATKNADKMIQALSADINAARQLAITNEITEIAAASEVSGAV